MRYVNLHIEKSEDGWVPTFIDFWTKKPVNVASFECNDASVYAILTLRFREQVYLARYTATFAINDTKVTRTLNPQIRNWSPGEVAELGMTMMGSDERIPDKLSPTLIRPKADDHVEYGRIR